VDANTRVRERYAQGEGERTKRASEVALIDKIMSPESRLNGPRASKVEA